MRPFLLLLPDLQIAVAAGSWRPLLALNDHDAVCEDTKYPLTDFSRLYELFCVAIASAESVRRHLGHKSFCANRLIGALA